ANIPPVVEDMIERLSGYPIYSIMDAISGYDQIPITASSQDLTAIWTPLGTLRSTVLPQGFNIYYSIGVLNLLHSRRNRKC
ncbi:hypothetical protein HMI56_005565, partial [Coelomomyces lativittatus]